ncbi:MAG: tellurite resistance protein [Rhodospirillaceae bacterium]|mgnify:CR=1 FL=1|nr:tellurite resistance protein [Rhodospirillaceae bacterium]|tara:strand:+ start:2718 stop:2987 length:270 start_codon:yes stop_codon:yes gene_type:complete
METLPRNVTAYKRTPTFTEETVPGGLLKDHSTADGVWGLIQIESGKLEYTIGDDEIHELTPGNDGVVQPTVTHHIRPIGEVAFFVEFYK